MFPPIRSPEKMGTKSQTVCMTFLLIHGLETFDQGIAQRSFPVRVITFSITPTGFFSTLINGSSKRDPWLPVRVCFLGMMDAVYRQETGWNGLRMTR